MTLPIPDLSIEPFIVEFESETYGKFTATFPLNATPLWHGSYMQAVLSLYNAEITGTPNAPLGVFLFVINDKYQRELDFAGHIIYDAMYTPKAVIENSMMAIGNMYALHLQQQAEIGAANGSISIQ